MATVDIRTLSSILAGCSRAYCAAIVPLASATSQHRGSMIAHLKRQVIDHSRASDFTPPYSYAHCGPRRWLKQLPRAATRVNDYFIGDVLAIASKFLQATANPHNDALHR
jgi:hypothetical protein